MPVQYYFPAVVELKISENYDNGDCLYNCKVRTSKAVVPNKKY